MATEIAVLVDAETKHVTMYITNEHWGPIVTGKNLAEVKAKFIEAFGLSMIANSFLDSDDQNNPAERFTDLRSTLESVL